MTVKTALSLFGGAMIALGGTTATAQQQESLDEWMNRITGQESSPTPAERPAETTPSTSPSTTHVRNDRSIDERCGDGRSIDPGRTTSGFARA